MARQGDAIVYCEVFYLSRCHVEAFSAASRRNALARSHAARMVNPRLVWRVRALLQAPKPSTGLVGVAVALRICARVRLYGFGSMAPTREAPAAKRTCAHYYDCRMNDSAYYAMHNRHAWAAQAPELRCERQRQSGNPCREQGFGRQRRPTRAGGNRSRKPRGYRTHTPHWTSDSTISSC